MKDDTDVTITSVAFVIGITSFDAIREPA